MLFEMWLGHPLIEADNVWGLLGVMCVSVALAIGLEQKYQWASRVSGSIIALILAMLMANVGIIPTQSIQIFNFSFNINTLRHLIFCLFRKLFRRI